MEFAYLIVGIVVGVAIGWLMAKNKKPEVVQDNEQLNWMRTEHEKAEQELKLEREKNTSLTAELSTERTNLTNLKERLDTQKKELEELQQKFTEQFENIARKVMMDNSQRFSEEHKKKLDDVLNPFKEKIDKFEKTVSETNESRIKESASLKEHIATLQKLNENIGEEAKNLTTALKGDSKMQGNWGEFILEKVLESSGLEKGREYETQVSENTEEGRLQPDAVVHLPDDKHIIVDSKVSLVAYERYANANTDEERNASLKELFVSVRTHVKQLSEKGYHQHLYKGKTPDYTLMFIPIEPAFITLVRNDQTLFNDAYLKNIVIVSTSTLLATLKTVSSIWRQEKQTQNALEIARQAGALYDKFTNFADDLRKLGDQMNTAKGTFDKAYNKLYDGKDNLVRKTEKLKELGANTSKSIPQNLLDRAEE